MKVKKTCVGRCGELCRSIHFHPAILLIFANAPKSSSMKITILLTASMLFFSTIKIFAQCNPSVPFNAVVVNTTQTINGGFDPIWVCSGDTLHSDGGFHNTFLESGSVMTTSGGIDTIYVKPGASFFMNGGIHVIYYTSLADLNISGGIPTTDLCTALIFDYSNAPTNGCALALQALFEASDSNFCVGNCTDFIELSNGATSWQWSFPGGNPASSADQNPTGICYDQDGSYDVTLIVSDGTVNDTLTLNDFITVNPLPSAPLLFQSNDTLYSSTGFAGYQWYYESTLINGATNYFYVFSQGGDYAVVVTDNNGCQASAVIKTIGTGISNPLTNSNQVRVFPNPAGNTIVITDDLEETLQFVDLLGREFFRLVAQSQKNINVDISAFPAVFFVRSENGGIVKVIHDQSR